MTFNNSTTIFQNKNKSDFVNYIGLRLSDKLKKLYGDDFPELIDIQMRKIVYEKNKQLIRRLGLTPEQMNEFNENVLYYDPIGTGYLYGQPLSKSWEWANAIMNGDIETQQRIKENELIEEAKYKSQFISYHHIELCDPDEERVKSRDSGRQLLVARRKNKMSENNDYKQFLDKQDTWFMK
jgi:hypothetical protein